MGENYYNLRLAHYKMFLALKLAVKEKKLYIKRQSIIPFIKLLLICFLNL